VVFVVETILLVVVAWSLLPRILLQIVMVVILVLHAAMDFLV
jgi:hypothetical protein